MDAFDYDNHTTGRSAVAKTILPAESKELCAWKEESGEVVDPDDVTVWTELEDFLGDRRMIHALAKA